MKYITTILFLLLGILEMNAQTVRPIESEAMYKQLRSMEDGPWEFAPDAYYYSWVRRSDTTEDLQVQVFLATVMFPNINPAVKFVLR